MEEGWAQANPVVGTRKPADPKPRDRVLSNAELVAIWNACADDDHGRIIRLLVLLGRSYGAGGGGCGTFIVHNELMEAAPCCKSMI